MITMKLENEKKNIVSIIFQLFFIVYYPFSHNIDSFFLFLCSTLTPFSLLSFNKYLEDLSSKKIEQPLFC
jgi:hypothetical protein